MNKIELKRTYICDFCKKEITDFFKITFQRWKTGWRNKLNDSSNLTYLGENVREVFDEKENFVVGHFCNLECLIRGFEDSFKKGEDETN